jgi:apolipoprotein D and lipocalin family protein
VFGMSALRVLLLSLALAVLAGCTAVPAGIQPVRGFQVERYLGTWHEIARLDHRFERGLTDVTATYARRDDGGIDVLNRGWDAAAGQWREARGRAYFLDAPDVASLKVSFFGPFYGGYHVFALDDDYRWAVVSGPSRDYFWILARQPTLDPATRSDLIERARRAGFDTDTLIFPTPAKGGTP